jgi:hypothetical protein
MGPESSTGPAIRPSGRPGIPPPARRVLCVARETRRNVWR